MVAAKAPADSASLPPAKVVPGGTYTVQQVFVGCKIFITRPGPDGKLEERLAEILSIRDKPNSPDDPYEFFVHWDAFNKRLDEWVSGSRLLLHRDLEWPRPKPPPVQKKGAGKKAPPGKRKDGNLLKKATANASLAASSPVPQTPVVGTPTPGFLAHSPSPAPSLKRKAPHDEMDISEPATPMLGDDPDADGEADADGEDDDMDVDTTVFHTQSDLMAQDEEAGADLDNNDFPTFSKEQEIEKLRTSGSMTQSISEIQRVKNLNKLSIGKHVVEAWYFSPYPKEFAHLSVIFICEFCLHYFSSEFQFKRHRTRCHLLHPPGNQIYSHEDISFWEIDGKKQVTWCRNLSLLSKCFLDHKTLYYDVTPFLYYVMTLRDSGGHHIIGYFSKEKESAENYNVACILTLPQHQRHGYGKLLIEFSYELSKKEGRLGSPEKPLSDLGLLGYRAYWQETIVELLLNAREDEEMSIDDIAHKTSITHADVLNTCTTLQLFKHHKGSHLINLSNSVLEKHTKVREKRRRRIIPAKLEAWKPPVFTRDQLRFGW